MAHPAIWDERRDAILMSCATASEAAERLGLSPVTAKNRMRILRRKGKTTHVFTPEWVFWTPERDEALMACDTGGEAVAKFGKSINYVTARMVVLRRKGLTTKMWRRPKSKRPAKNTKASWDIAIEREAQRGAYVPVKECNAFLDALAAHEKPPASVSVRDRQPLMRNPALYQGGLGASSINMDME